MSNLFLVISVVTFAAIAFVILAIPAEAVLQAPDGSHLYCEIAKTAAERERGLMDRPSLCPDCCMLFVFDNSAKQSFWMKNTLIPLDLVFLDVNYSVVDVKSNFAPCVKVPCEVYSSKAPARYVVEVNAGEATNRQIAEGSALTVVVGHSH